jgi:hypothetical protein
MRAILDRGSPVAAGIPPASCTSDLMRRVAGTWLEPTSPRIVGTPLEETPVGIRPWAATDRPVLRAF